MKQGLRAVIIGILASFILLLPAYAATFSDVSEYSSYYDAVDYVTQRGIMAGYSEGTFKPDNMLTRGQISAILCRMIGENENLPVNGNIFSDVPASHWANGYITKAVSLGIINGFQDGTFRSLSPVTYNQALAMLIRAFGLRQEAENAGGYPQGYWNVANQYGLLEGVSTKGPSNKGIRRYEIAVIMYNYFRDDAHSYAPTGTENGSPSDAYESDGYTSIPSTLVQSNWSEIGGSDEWCPYFKFADGSRCEIMVTMGEWTEKVPATYAVSQYEDGKRVIECDLGGYDSGVAKISKVLLAETSQGDWLYIGGGMGFTQLGYKFTSSRSGTIRVPVRTTSILDELQGKTFVFSSGAGAWGTTLTFGNGGSFEGSYHDSEMGETGTRYPYGTVYFCDFAGQFTGITKIDDFTYAMRVINLKLAKAPGTEEVENGFRYVSSEPYGMENAGLFYLYLPGHSTSSLPDEFVGWVSMPNAWGRNSPPVLPFWGLYNEGGQAGFFCELN